MSEKVEIVKRSREELVTLSEWAEKCERWEGKYFLSSYSSILRDG